MRARDWTGGGWGGIEELGSEERSDESVGHEKLPLTQTLWAPLARGKQPLKYLIPRGTESRWYTRAGPHVLITYM